MVIIASHTAGGNLTVFLPRKHPRLCPRSLTTWMAAKLSSSYYNHLITEAPPCALPVFFFFFFTSIFTGLLWDVLHNQQSYSHERMHWDNLLFKMMSSWQRQSRSGSNRRALDIKKKTQKKLLCSCLYRSLFHECFYQKGLAGVSVSERGIRKEVDLRSLSRSPGRNSKQTVLESSGVI